MENTVKKVNVRVGDTVLVLAGNYKGKKGKIIAVDPEHNTCKVEGVNIVTKHKKMRKQGEKSELKKMEGPIDISNVQIICGKCGKATRIGHQIENDVKHRVCKKCGAVLDKKFVKAKAKDAEAQEAAEPKAEAAKKPLQRREVKHVAESTIKKPAAKKAEKAETTAKGGK
ncbi:MAG: 50S ribosomal protein L24 [Eubacteriales bacterium]|nr:50S ribosomal protein L24 [Eubacteriales bacterium]